MVMDSPGLISSGLFGSHSKSQLSLYCTLPGMVEKPWKQESPAAEILLKCMKKNIGSKRKVVFNFLNLGTLSPSFEFFILSDFNRERLLQ